VQLELHFFFKSCVFPPSPHSFIFINVFFFFLQNVVLELNFSLSRVIPKFSCNRNNMSIINICSESSLGPFKELDQLVSEKEEEDKGYHVVSF
jgi:hypothetical protein